MALQTKKYVYYAAAVRRKPKEKVWGTEDPEFSIPEGNLISPYGAWPLRTRSPPEPTLSDDVTLFLFPIILQLFILAVLTGPWSFVILCARDYLAHLLQVHFPLHPPSEYNLTPSRALCAAESSLNRRDTFAGAGRLLFFR